MAVELGLEDREAAAGLLGGVHRDVGALLERLVVLAVQRVHGDADARVDLEPHALEHERLAQVHEQVLGDRGAVAGGLHAREQDAELVAAEAGDGVGLAQREPQPARDLLEQQVAHVMAERVVDLLEVIEVHDHHHGRLAAAARRVDGLVDAVAEEFAVRQAREGVMERLVLLGDRVASAAVHGVERQEQQGDRRQEEIGGEQDDGREAEQQAAGRDRVEEVAHQVAQDLRALDGAITAATMTVFTTKNVPMASMTPSRSLGACAARRSAACRS